MSVCVRVRVWTACCCVYLATLSTLSSLVFQARAGAHSRTHTHCQPSRMDRGRNEWRLLCQQHRNHYIICKWLETQDNRIYENDILKRRLKSTTQNAMPRCDNFTRFFCYCCVISIPYEVEWINRSIDSTSWTLFAFGLIQVRASCTQMHRDGGNSTRSVTKIYDITKPVLVLDLQISIRTEIPKMTSRRRITIKINNQLRCAIRLAQNALCVSVSYYRKNLEALEL